MSRLESPRDKMVQSAALLMREHGVENTSFSQVVVHSGAPRGSIYHYFPGGKAQLVEEAVRWSGDVMTQAFRHGLETGDPLTLLAAAHGFWRGVLEGSDFAAGCPVAAGSLEAERTPAVRDAAGQVFAEWQDVIAQGLTERGVPEERARSLAAMTFAGIEGAVLMARAQRSMAPVEATLDELRRLVADALREAEG